MPDPQCRGFFRADIFDVLRDRAAFADIISREFHEYALAQDCLIQCSLMRLFHAHKFFLDDLKNVLENRLPNGPKTVDHLKFGAFHGFWLRRMLPINTTSFLGPEARILEEDFDEESASDEHRFFAVYGNEYCSFRAAFDVAQYVHLENQRLGLHEGTVVLTKADMISPSMRTVKEIVVTLKHKNNSPHSFYTTLLALFETLQPGPPR